MTYAEKRKMFLDSKTGQQMMEMINNGQYRELDTLASSRHFTREFLQYLITRLCDELTELTNQEVAE